MRLMAGWLYALGLAAVVGGGIVFLSNIPNAPGRDDLVRAGGHLVGIVLEKDLDGTDIVYLRFRDDDTLYKYLSVYPQYVEIRDRLGIYRQVDLLVEAGTSPGSDGAVRIWQLVEHDPYRESTVVTYDEIYAEVTQTDRSWQRIGLYVVAAGVAAVLLGYGIRRLIPHVPREPTA